MKERFKQERELITKAYCRGIINSDELEALFIELDAAEILLEE